MERSKQISAERLQADYSQFMHWAIEHLTRRNNRLQGLEQKWNQGQGFVNRLNMPDPGHVPFHSLF